MTQDRIQHAITQLEASGERVSIRQIHRLTGGSFRDISRLLRAFRPTRPTATLRSLQLAIAEQTKTVRISQILLRVGDVRRQAQAETALHRNEAQLAQLQAALQRRETQRSGTQGKGL